jgi:hypothetical protein
VFDVLALPLGPCRLRVFERVTAIANDIGDRISEAGTNLGERFLAALVFGTIVQERGNRFVFASAGFHHDACNRKQMGDVWDRRALSTLRAVQRRRVG